mmetsp:Transcript_47615/g.123406  ORF Transcript_47615/g.123406 Transcript_47615/m.123406 type:complete len:248 (+) Transcript_47615:1739-2482(+)
MMWWSACVFRRLSPIRDCQSRPKMTRHVTQQSLFFHFRSACVAATKWREDQGDWWAHRVEVNAHCCDGTQWRGMHVVHSQVRVHTKVYHRSVPHPILAVLSLQPCTALSMPLHLPMPLPYPVLLRDRSRQVRVAHEGPLHHSSEGRALTTIVHPALPSAPSQLVDRARTACHRSCQMTACSTQRDLLPLPLVPLRFPLFRRHQLRASSKGWTCHFRSGRPALPSRPLPVWHRHCREGARMGWTETLR